jgi:hypothetical protein
MPLLMITCGSSQGGRQAIPDQVVDFTFRSADYEILFPIRNVAIAGSFNDWNTQSHYLKDDDGDGIWMIIIKLKPGRYSYMYIINGHQWLTPRGANEYIDDGFGGMNAIVNVSVPLP